MANKYYISDLFIYISRFELCQGFDAARLKNMWKHAFNQPGPELARPIYNPKPI